MLVLSRKLGEEIIIDGHIRVKISAINGNRAKIAIDAPREIAIVRGEVLHQTEPVVDSSPDPFPRRVKTTTI